MQVNLDHKKRVQGLQCIFYVDVIQRHQGVSLSERSTGVTLTTKKICNDGIQKEVVAAQLSDCSRLKVPSLILRTAQNT